ncbi:uncharacterized protein LOC108867329 [Pyrus x bretschneideri]|uniref:uncharacterized protein LOC108867329 n=1 Tax=Pyrus x bretschneideri TaxID=225117 RepID=UPI002030E8CA|nr:uncharacterized protein LOC108867329 [Pyrus x bretschneideri]
MLIQFFHCSVFINLMAEKANGVVDDQQQVVRPYPFHEIELKWQCHWEEIGLFEPQMKLIPRSPNTIFLICSLIPGRGFYALFRRMRMPSENSNARFLCAVPMDKQAMQRITNNDGASRE